MSSFTSFQQDPGDIAGIQAAFDAGESDPVALLESLLRRIDEAEPHVHAWTSVDCEGALQQAVQARDSLNRGGRRSPMHGIPVAIKDVIDVAGFPTRAGSRARTGQGPAARDADVVRALRAAGAVILGKTHTTEFAYFDGVPPTRNPWNTAHTPGGSSAGSAAAVAAGMVPASLGTQTAGSVVRPAAYCGIAAFKPTGQNMSTHGVVPLAPAFDTLGWFGHRFSDVAAIGAALHAQRFLAPARPDSLRVALPDDALFADASPAVMDNLDRTVQALARAGHRIDRTAAPVALADAIAAHKTVLEYELSRLHGELATEHAQVLSPGWLAAIERGSSIRNEDHLAARAFIQQAQKTCWAAWADWDLLLVPAAPDTAPAGMPTGDPRYIIPFTALGGPIATLPVSLSTNGLPLGVMLCGRPGSDAGLMADALTLASAIEAPRNW
ncbi:amidase [Burkholderiaceae bacterium FT117]|uniref:amidase n=1 Tax=Zeimonas sediminis TaxID=2944268 RepID=UPI00234307DB|nr:amidase [Zeimonas sediminis]MCM5569742.1 amidase [Zeimonas sediminis]